MKILFLTKYHEKVGKNCVDKNDYLKSHLFFSSYHDAFVKLGHEIITNWDESFIFKTRYRIKFPSLFRIFNTLIHRTRLAFIDYLFYSLKILFITKKHKINLIFTETNHFLIPNIIKLFNKNIIISQWFGVFPYIVSRNCIRFSSQYDYIWTPCVFDSNKIKWKALNKAVYIGPATNKNLFYYDYDDSYNFDVVFIGSVCKHHNNRIEILEYVAMEFDNFAFYGYGMEDCKSTTLSKHFKGWVNPDEIRKIYSSSKIALNLTLNNYDSLKKGYNQRLLEIASCNGALQICKQDYKINDYLKIDKSVKCFEDKSDLISIIDYYLKNENKRQLIARNAFDESNSYTYHKKASKMCEILKKNKK